MRSLRAEARTLLYGILFLFSWQLFSEFIEGIYAFGLMGTSIPVEMASLLLLFSPLLLLAVRKPVPGWGLRLLGGGILASRAVEAALDTRGRMIASGIGVGCFLLWLPALLSACGRERPGVRRLGAGVTLGLALSVLLRVLGAGYDLSLQPGTQAIGWGLAGVGGALLIALRAPERGPEETSASGERAGVGRTVGLSLGLTSAWMLLYLSFTAPNVIARWTGASYPLVVTLVVGALFAFAALATFVPRLYARLTRWVLLAWNVFFCIALVGTILAHQVRFPSGAEGYPLFEPAVTLMHRVPLWGMLVLFPVLLVDWTRCARAIVRARPTARVLGASFGLASLFTLLAVLGQVFTTVYDYIPVVGPTFRDRFWLVYLLPGIVVSLSTLLVGPHPSPSSAGRKRRVSYMHCSGSLAYVVVMALIGVGALAGVALMAPRPGAPPGGQAGLRVCTYNIRQGYDAAGSRNPAGQLALLRGVDADLIGLQETDTNRVAGGNADIVRAFASALDMHSYYGPKTVPGTFGIALLSKYPIEDAQTFYMYSAGEQTATIAARIRVGDKAYQVYVTHLGNGGPIVQQEAILGVVAGQENVLLMGDFNFRPDSAQYHLTTAVLDDAWQRRWPAGVDDQGRRFDRRIDHIFVSPGTAVLDAQYITDPASDHPALVVEIE